MKNPQKNKLGFACIAVCIIILLKQLNTINNWDSGANYYSYEEATLPSAEDPSFAPKNNSIFFHETSYPGELTAPQACSVESAARAHPQRDIYVLFSSPVPEHALRTSCLAKLLQFPNVKFLRVHIVEYSKGTVVQSILLNDLKESVFPTRHTADILKMLTLNKWGGVCLESKIIIVNPLEQLPRNWILKKHEKYVATGLISLSKDETGANISSSILEEIYKTYDPKSRSACGRRAIQTVVERMCPRRIYWDSCKDISIYTHELFYPVDNIIWTSKRIVYSQPSFSFRIWNINSSEENIKNKPYEMLARRYCPSIFDLYRHELGV